MNHKFHTFCIIQKEVLVCLDWYFLSEATVPLLSVLKGGRTRYQRASNNLTDTGRLPKSRSLYEQNVSSLVQASALR